MTAILRDFHDIVVLGGFDRSYIVYTNVVFPLPLEKKIPPAPS